MCISLGVLGCVLGCCLDCCGVHFVLWDVLLVGLVLLAFTLWGWGCSFFD